jgi:hypothetical protein
LVRFFGTRKTLVDGHTSGLNQPAEEIPLRPARLVLARAAQVFLLVADDHREDCDVDVAAPNGVLDHLRFTVEVIPLMPGSMCHCDKSNALIRKGATA